MNENGGGYIKMTLNAGNTLNYSISGKKFREKMSILDDLRPFQVLCKLKNLI
jgi:hypothetical protein